MDNEIENLITERIEKNTRRRINNERYANDPVYREKINKAAREWNEAHPTRRKEIKKKWAKKNGPAAQKRYRQRKKKSNGS